MARNLNLQFSLCEFSDYCPRTEMYTTLKTWTVLRNNKMNPKQYILIAIGMHKKAYNKLFDCKNEELICADSIIMCASHVRE